MPLGDEDELIRTARWFHGKDHARARQTVSLWTDRELADVIDALMLEDESAERDALLAFVEDARQERQRTRWTR